MGGAYVQYVTRQARSLHPLLVKKCITLHYNVSGNFPLPSTHSFWKIPTYKLQLEDCATKWCKSITLQWMCGVESKKSLIKEEVQNNTIMKKEMDN